MNRLAVSLSVSIFAALMTATGCGDNANLTPDSQPDAPPAASPIAVAAAPLDYKAPGIVSKLDVESLAIHMNISGGIAAVDPILRNIGDEIYLIDRTSNNITILNATTLDYVDQIATGAGSNPQDVAVVGNKLYIPALGTAGVVIATRGGTPTPLDLQATLGCQGSCKPSCVSAYAVGNDVYVACDLLDNFMPVGNGKISVIDATTDTVRKTIEMPVKNPQNLFVRSPDTSAFAGDLLIPTLDSTTLTNGCIVRVTPGETPSATCAIQNSDLGGTATHIDVLDGDAPLLLLAVTSDFTDGQLRALDLQTASLWSGSLSPATQTIRDVAACPNGSAVVADTAGSGGLRVYTGSGVELTTAALPIGLPPGFGNDLVCYVPNPLF